MAGFLRRFLREKRGVTILEYGLILAAATLIILSLAALFGSDVINRFQALNSGVTTANETASGTTP
ncbi:MAG: Flp family type IVb pilin [Rhodothalassiaceae bacterium]